jgi:hypothetical protein
MEREGCGTCKHGQLVWLPRGETHGGVHDSDKHIDMYVCHHRRAQHYGHMMVGDHYCLGFKERPAEK